MKIDLNTSIKDIDVIKLKKTEANEDIVLFSDFEGKNFSKINDKEIQKELLNVDFSNENPPEVYSSYLEIPSCAKNVIEAFIPDFDISRADIYERGDLIVVEIDNKEFVMNKNGYIQGYCENYFDGSMMIAGKLPNEECLRVSFHDSRGNVIHEEKYKGMNGIEDYLLNSFEDLQNDENISITTYEYTFDENGERTKRYVNANNEQEEMTYYLSDNKTCKVFADGKKCTITFYNEYSNPSESIEYNGITSIEELYSTPLSEINSREDVTIIKKSYEYAPNNTLLNVKTTDSEGAEVVNFEVNEIVENSKQGYAGDCWLLCAVNSLSQTEIGKKAIQNAIDVDENGNYTVSLYDKFGELKSYKITPLELAQAKENNLYSSGDTDVLVLELAFEKRRINNDADKSLEECLNSEIPNSVLSGGFFDEGIQALTNRETLNGKCGSDIGGAVEYVIDEYSTNCITLSFVSTNGEDVIVRDVNGNEVMLCQGAFGHGWSFVSKGKKELTMRNPWNSEQSITISYKELKKINAETWISFVPDFY